MVTRSGQARQRAQRAQTSQTAQARKDPPHLTPELIHATALAMVDADGIDGLSMRKLAGVLGVSPMTIYLRFENKDALMRAVRRQLVMEVVEQQVLERLARAASRDWRDDAFEFAVTVRKHFLAHPFGPGLYQREDWDVAAIALSNYGLQLMERAGFSGPAAVDAFRALFWHIAGFVLAQPLVSAAGPVPDSVMQQAADEYSSTFNDYRHLFSSVDPDALFETMTRALIAGLSGGH